MSRAKRIQAENIVYHIITKSNNRERFFNDDTDRNRYLNLWRAGKNKYFFDCYAYCLMDTHTHFLIKPLLPNLSKIMQSINTAYVMYYNRKYSRKGTLVMDRFKNFPVTTDIYLFTALKYIHLNPVKAGIVKDPHEYKWSSDRIYMTRLKDDFVDVGFIPEIFSEDIEEQIEIYASIVES